MFEGSNSTLGNGECGVSEERRGCFKGRTNGLFESTGLTDVEGRGGISLYVPAVEGEGGDSLSIETKMSAKGS